MHTVKVSRLVPVLYAPPMVEESKDDFLRELDELLQGESENGIEQTEANHIDLEPTANLSEVTNADVKSSTPPPISPQPKTGLDILKAAIVAHESIEGLFEGGKVPDDVRLEYWKECLNVTRRPDALGSWSGPLDCENQDVIHSQCQEQAGKLTLTDDSAKEQAIENMEQVITYYCKSRNIRYSPDCGWPELLVPFVSLSISRADLFNCFYGIMAKYIPRDCKADGRPFHLFRLLLLYHDPELCSYMDTKKLAPDTYLQPWLRSLFASPCEPAVVNVLWDHYLMEKDPFFVFFLALVMIVNAKELVMENSEASKKDLLTLISSLPCQLSAEDVPDFFSLAQYYASRTPQSFRKDFHSLLFGSGRSHSSLGTSVSHALCLPISLQEVIEMNQSEGLESGGVQYIVVDCRPVEHFSCGHLPNSFNLDANLLLHSPNDFSTAADRLCSKVKHVGLEGGDHLCFLGSGREQEDQYVTMVVAKFLQKSTPYISWARGGFLELRSLLGSKLKKVLDDYDASSCQELYSDDPINPVRSDTSDSDSEGYGRYRQKLQARGAKLYSNLASGFKGRSQNLKAKFGGFWTAQKKVQPEGDKHVSQLDKPSKRYRNVNADVFVIADEDEENENPGASSSEDDSGQEMVNISLFSTSPEILQSFVAVEIKNGAEFHSHILLTTDSLMVLRELSDRAGWARVKHRHKLESVLKITAKKKHPDIITFKFGTGSGDNIVITEQLRFRIPNTQKATNAIKTQILKYTQTQR